jgi:hypothetical protein
MYTRELRANLGYTATWLPNAKLSLGDVGILSNYEYVYRTNLKHLGIPFEEGPRSAKGTYSHTSANSVTRSLKLAGKAPLEGSALGEADAGITFDFKRNDAIVFYATDCTVRPIADQEPLKKTILDAFLSGKWEKNYVVVTELVEAGSTSIIIAEGSGGKFEVKAKAGVAPTMSAMNLEGNFEVLHESQIGFNFLAKSGMTPLFRCLGIRTNWFRTDVVTREAVFSEDGPGGAASQLAVDEVEYDDFPDSQMTARP